MSVVSQKLFYSEFGEPVKVVRLEEENLQVPKTNEVLIRMLAAPVNPADIITLQGLYPTKPSLPAVPGNEGVGEVLSVGSAVDSLKPGDRVTAQTAINWGTWRTHAVCDAGHVYKIPKELSIVDAATMSVNPYTAYRMLKDFVPLSEGDVVIQNGANSACGQYVIELCKVWGYHTVNVVRDRPNIDELKENLKELGATYVLTEDELWETEMFKSGKVARPRLALNCVGGASGELLARQLEYSSTMVTYGAMSKQPVPAHAAFFIYNNLTWRGFWVSEWMKQHTGSPQHLQMKDHVSQLLIERKLSTPVHKLVPITAYKEALANTSSGTALKSVKYIFNFQN
ncbi:hypothetical protein PR048_030141 [Dryococelus australis]|uniref:Enoyl-[acyl-carrier-protein] reductase, mitochondrial n=1 Tax=Dryococelus australis TaxID=614101 RepID=A0ABQ9GAZ5_9NEOP|nr:hypothetical protein PR048_030141 [Dryococelus australis]